MFVKSLHRNYKQIISFSGFNHFNYLFFCFAIVIVTYKLNFKVICNSTFFVTKQAFFQFIWAVSPRKFCKWASPKFIKNTSGTRKFRKFPASVKPLFCAAIIVLIPAMTFASSIPASFTVLGFRTEKAYKSAISYSSPFRLVPAHYEIISLYI